MTKPDDKALAAKLRMSKRLGPDSPLSDRLISWIQYAKNYPDRVPNHMTYLVDIVNQLKALESKTESLEALEAAVEAQIEIGEKLFEHNPYAIGSLEAYRYVLKLIAQAKKQGEKA